MGSGSLKLVKVCWKTHPEHSGSIWP